MKISQNLKEVLEFLGNEYFPKEIDFEICAYRKLNKYYDVEITGCNYKRRPFKVYIWDITNGAGVTSHIVRRSGDIKTMRGLKVWLENNLRDFYEYNPKAHEK